MAPRDAAALIEHFRSPEAARPALVGRERDVAELVAAFDAAAGGQGGSYLVTGEPGIGKTRIADALSDAARARGARVAWGRCWEAGGAPPHWPWVQVVRTLVEDLDEDELGRALGPQAAGVLALTPELRERLSDPPPAAPAGDGESARFAAWDATAAFLSRAAREQPLLVVLDDVHVADLPSLLLLRFVARSLRGARLLVVATCRDAEARAQPEVAALVDEVAREGRRLTLTGLGEAEVATLAGVRVGRRPPAAFARELRAATGGNPFWVQEVMELRVVDGTGDPWAAPCPVPAELGATLATRVAALPVTARELLSVAAVVGHDWDEARVGGLAGADPGELARAVAAAAEAHLLLPHAGGFGRHRFAHALVRDALYDALEPERRRALHGAIATALERDDPGDVAQLAHHFAAAGHDAAGKAHAYARAAGDAAVAALAFEEAAAHYERALALGDPPAADACDLRLALGDSHMRAGDTQVGRDEFLRAAATARELGSAERLAAAALGFGSAGELWANGQVDETLVALLEEALAALAETPSALRALTLARLADALLYARDWPRTDALSAQAVEAARGAGDDFALMRALAARLLALLRPSTLGERLELTDELGRLADGAGSPEQQLESLSWQITIAMEVGDGAAIDEHIARFRQIAEALRQPHMLWGARLHAATRALLLGRLEEAERLAHEAIAVAEGVVPLAGPMFAVQMLGIRGAQGRLGEVEPGLRAFVQQFPEVRSWRTAWAAVLLATGAEQEARAELQRIARAGFLINPDDYEWLVAMVVLAEAFAHLGDRERCAVLYERLLPYADRAVVVSIAVSCAGPVALPLALMAEALGDVDAAGRHFEQALAVCDRLGARAFSARTRFEHGRMLVRTGADPERGRELLHQAADEADSMGMGIAGQARALLTEHADQAASVAVFARAEDYWSVGHPASPLRLRDSKGLRYLAELLPRPGTEIAAAELAGAAAALGDAGPALDPAAKDAYRRRIDDLRAEIDEADRFHDGERAARAREELDAVTAELAGAVGLGGRDRRAASAAERARVSVTKAIRTAIKRIAEHDSELGDHLARSVRTGAFCVYDPPARDRIDWRL